LPGSLNRRSYVLIGAALALPIVVLAATQLVFAFSRERETIEERALTRAEEVVLLADARVEADLSVMETLVTEDAFERAAWPAAYSRAREIAARNPHWRNVLIADLETRREVFSLRRPYGEPRPLDASFAPVRVGGVAREGPGCPCVYLSMPIGAAGRHFLVVALDPAAFQAILLQRAPPDSVAALVDRDGAFIARSIEYEQRVGTPAAPFVRDAVASDARSGFYPGAAYEGFDNHTAYATSALTGWSAHIAVASALIDRPRLYSLASMAIGAALALALAAGLVAWALRDLSERRRAEARLAQTQKLEAVGQLTGGVAHDFNNLLTVVIGGLNMLLRRLEDQKQREIAEHMLDAARRGEKLTRQLLAFSRGQQVELVPVDLHQLVPGMEELLRRSIEPGTTLSFDLHPGARWVRSDANQLELAVLNLVINARDAMPEGGRIAVAVRPSRRPGHIELSVSDTGIGMPKEVAERALEPFFTTKPAGKGTGLGLAQVFGAARQSGGGVEIDTAPGRGATVRLVLPRTDAPKQDAAAAQTEAAPSQGPGPNRRVLVVDDEPGVRTFIAETLREAGYEALEAQDPGAALRLLESNPPHLLLTDYSMPGMSGLELAQHARAKHAPLRVLIVSGYADADAVRSSAVRPALLRKPFDVEALLEAVQSALAPDEPVSLPHEPA
jgi:signal transduction histidine kinase/CheY-like chemotaxis protein